jgi:hypothetical protein
METNKRALQTPLGYRRLGARLRRRTPLAPPAHGITSYHLAGKTLAEFAASFLWLSLWLFNGFCTVIAWVGFNTWLFTHLHWMASPIWLSLWLQVPSGIVVHLLVSAIEQHLWRAATPPALGIDIIARCKAVLISVRTWESVLVGSLDSFTTSRTLVALAMLFGFSGGLPTIVWCGVLGTALALGTEPMLRYHGITLKSFVRR